MTRRCGGCRRVAAAPELVRLTVRDGELVPDPARRLGGRGLNVHPDPRCLDRALAPRALARSLRLPEPPDTAAARAGFGASVPGSGRAVPSPAATTPGERRGDGRHPALECPHQTRGYRSPDRETQWPKASRWMSMS